MDVAEDAAAELLALDAGSIDDPDELREALRRAHAALEAIGAEDACKLCAEQAPGAEDGADLGAGGGGGPGGPPFSVETLAAMLRREHELRISPETQQAYAGEPP
jgi:hypothetical protein